MSLLNFNDIFSAYDNIKDYVVKTPLLSSPMLNKLVGANVFIKPESLQLTGSFKIRGALNKMLSLSPSQLSSGVITYSAGNHGQALSAAAKILGSRATIVMPETAPAVKRNSCLWWGADVVTYNSQKEDREVIAGEIAGQNNLTFIPPFNDLQVMAGQGTAGLELCEQLNDLNITPDLIMSGCSGGGLASGVHCAVSQRYENIQYVLVEAEGYQKWKKSLSVGAPVKLADLPATVMDGIAGPAVGSLPFEYLSQQSVECGVSTSIDAFTGMCAAYRFFKLVLEPGAAAALGVLIRDRQNYKNLNIVVVCSGGNVDPDLFSEALVSAWDTI